MQWRGKGEQIGGAVGSAESFESVPVVLLFGGGGLVVVDGGGVFGEDDFHGAVEEFRSRTVEVDGDAGLCKSKVKILKVRQFRTMMKRDTHVLISISA